jgi:hypothetical protein
MRYRQQAGPNRLRNLEGRCSCAWRLRGRFASPVWDRRRCTTRMNRSTGMSPTPYGPRCPAVATMPIAIQVHHRISSRVQEVKGVEDRTIVQIKSFTFVERICGHVTRPLACGSRGTGIKRRRGAFFGRRSVDTVHPRRRGRNGGSGATLRSGASSSRTGGATDRSPGISLEARPPTGIEGQLPGVS